jgi:predicted dehydrogenase
MGTDHSDGRIRVGVLGAWRGAAFAQNAALAGMALVAVCDRWEERLREVGERFGVAQYTDYDRFLEHDMDAVIVANHFHEHAPFAMKALRSGRHVMSETSACRTLGEGVALAREVERSGRIYLFAENYPYLVYNQEMRRLYRAGEIGELQYGEGEYNHPGSSRDRNELAPGMNHWRNHIPATYYCSHALAPLLYITDTRPRSVNAQCIPYSPMDEDKRDVRTNDIGSVSVCRMNNGAVVRLMGINMHGHSLWYRLHGTRGLMENLRTGDPFMLRVVHEAWDMKPGDVQEKIYKPEFPDHGTEARQAGHGGGDFFTNFHFAQAIRENRQPWLDVYRGLDMTLTGIQAYRSALQDGAPVEIPDFRDESVRKRFETDDWSPWPEDRKEGQPWPSVTGRIVPGEESIRFARTVWDEMGYKGE